MTSRDTITAIRSPSYSTAGHVVTFDSNYTPTS